MERPDKEKLAAQLGKRKPPPAGRILWILAGIFGGMVVLVVGLVAASYVFKFEVPWVNITIGWVMIVVPSSLFVLATFAGKPRR